MHYAMHVPTVTWVFSLGMFDLHQFMLSLACPCSRVSWLCSAFANRSFMKVELMNPCSSVGL